MWGGVPLFSMAQQPQVIQGLLIIEASWSHSDTPHSVGLLWTSDQLFALISTRQNTTLTTEGHSCLCWDSNPQLSKRAAAHPRLRPRSHWDRPFFHNSGTYPKSESGLSVTVGINPMINVRASCLCSRVTRLPSRQPVVASWRTRLARSAHCAVSDTPIGRAWVS